MRVLVVDTALGLCSAGVFLVEGGAARPLGLRSEVMSRGHSERLAGFVRDAVAEAGGGFGAIDRIGVAAGPGSFTGLRVGLAFAQGLGAALDRPVVGISALDALAASLPSSATSSATGVAALVDARRGQVYGRFWIKGVATGPAEALAVTGLPDRVAGLGAGAALAVWGAVPPDGFEPGLTVLSFDGPSPGALARLTAAADPATAPPRPIYLRAPDATPPSRKPGQPRARDA